MLEDDQRDWELSGDGREVCQRSIEQWKERRRAKRWPRRTARLWHLRQEEGGSAGDAGREPEAGHGETVKQRVTQTGPHTLGSPRSAADGCLQETCEAAQSREKMKRREERWRLDAPARCRPSPPAAWSVAGPDQSTQTADRACRRPDEQTAPSRRPLPCAPDGSTAGQRWHLAPAGRAASLSYRRLSGRPAEVPPSSDVEQSIWPTPPCWVASAGPSRLPSRFPGPLSVFYARSSGACWPIASPFYRISPRRTPIPPEEDVERVASAGCCIDHNGGLCLSLSLSPHCRPCAPPARVADGG